MEENKERWEKEREVRKKEEEKRLEDWDRMARFEKIEIIREREKKKNSKGMLDDQNYRLDENDWLTWRNNDKKNPQVWPSSAHTSIPMFRTGQAIIR